MAREVSKWITVNGNHVPIYEGESKADVRKRIEQLGSKSESKKGSSKKSSAKSEEAANKAAKKKSFEEATARLKAKETEAHRYKTLKEHDYEELTAAEKKELKQLQSKAYKGELDKKAPAKKEAFDHDKAVDFFMKKEGVTKEQATNMVENLGEERVKRMMEKGDMKKTEFKSGPTEFDQKKYEEAWNKKSAEQKKKELAFHEKISGIKSKETVERERAEAAKETKIDGATTISKKDFIKKYAEEYGMDADDFKQKGKDIKNFIIPEDDENPYIGVEYSDGTFWRYGVGRDLEVTRKELEESVGKPTQQDKDERVKQKQIANASKQKDALNNQKKDESDYKKYDWMKDDLKEGQRVQFKNDKGKTVEGVVVEDTNNGYRINLLKKDGTQDYNIAGTHRVNVDHKNILGWKDKPQSTLPNYTESQLFKMSNKELNKLWKQADKEGNKELRSLITTVAMKKKKGPM